MKGDVLFREGSTLGFVLRNDLIGETIEKLKVSRIPTPDGRNTWLVGVAQPVFEAGAETTHAATVTRRATELADSGNYSHITMARSWRTATGRAGGEATSTRVPDIIAVRWDGKVQAFEVASHGDDPDNLFRRLIEGMETLPAEYQTPIHVNVNIFELDP